MFHHLQEVDSLQRRLNMSKQDEEKKDIEGQLMKTITKRDLAEAKRVLTSLLIDTCTLNVRGLLSFTHVDSVYVSVTVVPYVPLPLLRYDRATGVSSWQSLTSLHGGWSSLSPASFLNCFTIFY